MKDITDEVIIDIIIRNTQSDLKMYYPVYCHCCGWYGLSKDTNVYPIADTGDYSDPTCQKCDSEVEDIEYLLIKYRNENKFDSTRDEY